jgi:hypothetical protein
MKNAFYQIKFFGIRLFVVQSTIKLRRRFFLTYRCGGVRGFVFRNWQVGLDS